MTYQHQEFCEARCRNDDCKFHPSFIPEGVEPSDVCWYDFAFSCDEYTPDYGPAKKLDKEINK